MKILITYEKTDMLRLVQGDLRAKGLKLKEGTQLEYKGAIEVKLYVEVEDEAATTPAVAPTALAPIEGATKPVITPPPSTEPVDMTEILSQSRKLGQGGGPFAVEKKPARPLGPNESLEFPK